MEAANDLEFQYNAFSGPRQSWFIIFVATDCEEESTGTIFGLRLSAFALRFVCVRTKCI